MTSAGWKVSVICPATQKYPLAFERIDGIAIYRHPLYVEAEGALGFLAEYSTALFHEFRLLLKVWRREGFDVIQACNPPDLIFLVALPFKLFGKRFIFDHHDVSPELFVAKYNRRGPLHALLHAFEWLTFKAADLVVSANNTFRDIAIARGGKRPDDVVTVYGVPDRSHIRRVDPDPSVRRGKRLVLGYIGIIGDQDGVDHVVRLVHALRGKGIADFQCVVVGDGPALAKVKALARDLGVDDLITFSGYLSGETLLAHLSSFDIGLIPDPINVYNDKISMNKVFEYSTLGIPSVAYPLTETMRLLRNGGIYAQTPDVEGLAGACLSLIEDDDLRERTGIAAKRISDSTFNWAREAAKYLEAYERLVPTPALEGQRRSP